MWRIVFNILIVMLTPSVSYPVEVRLKQGLIIGTKTVSFLQEKHYFAFYGVPYAQPPIGKLRFKDPENPKERKKIYARHDNKMTCAQLHIVHKHGKYGVEDCLYLNIYSPKLKSDASRAVIVWFHGYAFTASFSHLFGGDFFIEQDIVFVTVSYRIGVFGFANNNDTHVNMGLKDMAMALKWIKRNIKKFGGDSKRVTVMANGSAATYVSLVLMKYKNLYSKMILHSGSIFSPSMYKQNSLKETKLVEMKLTEKLKKTSTMDILKAAEKIYSSTDLLNVQRPIVPFTPVLEVPTKKSILTKNPNEIFKKQRHFNITKPILIGFNTRESITEVIPFLRNPKYLRTFGQEFKYMLPFPDGCSYDYNSTIYKEIAQHIKNYYFKNSISEKSVREFVKYTSDLMKYPVYKFIRSQLNVKSALFVYKFNYEGKYNVMKANSVSGTSIKLKGTASGDELCYIMPCEPMAESYASIKNKSQDIDVSVMMVLAEMWSNFAKTGDPNNPRNSANVTWLPMTIDDSNILLIDRELKMIGNDVEEKMFEFWNDLYDKYYSDTACKSSLVKDEL